MAVSYVASVFIMVTLTAMFPQTAAGYCNDTTDACFNGGTCTPQGCVCLSGYSGAECENTVVSVAILMMVCIMPLITWSIVCSYGYRNLRKNKARARRRRQRRRQQQANQQDANDDVPVDDDPPDYYQATYNNQISDCQGDDDYSLEPPPHYDDLEIVIKARSTSTATSGGQVLPEDGSEVPTDTVINCDNGLVVPFCGTTSPLSQPTAASPPSPTIVPIESEIQVTSPDQASGMVDSTPRDVQVGDLRNVPVIPV